MPTGWCGNTGWMPGYPLVVASVSRLGMSFATAGVLVSALFEISALTLAWCMLGQRSFLVLLACAVVPGQIYHHAIFPISMCMFFVLLVIRLLLTRRWVGASLCGAAAAFTYSTGFLTAPVSAAYAGTSAADDTQTRLRRIVVAGAGPILGLIAVFALHGKTVGAWDAFLRVQAKYHHGIYFPFATWLNAVRPLWDASGPRAPAVQALVVAIGLGVLVAWRRKMGIRSRDALLLGTACVFWLFPLVVGGVNLYRADSLLVPALLVLSDAPPWVNAAVCLGLAMLAFFMAKLFFLSVLV